MIGFFGLDDTNPSPGDVDAIDAELSRHDTTHEFTATIAPATPS